MEDLSSFDLEVGDTFECVVDASSAGLDIHTFCYRVQSITWHSESIGKPVVNYGLVDTFFRVHHTETLDYMLSKLQDGTFTNLRGVDGRPKRIRYNGESNTQE